MAVNLLPSGLEDSDAEANLASERIFSLIMSHRIALFQPRMA